MNDSETCSILEDDFRDKWMLSHHLIPMLYALYGMPPTLVILFAYLFETFIEGFPNFCSSLSDFEDPSNMILLDPISAILSVIVVYLILDRTKLNNNSNDFYDVRKFCKHMPWFFLIGIPSILLEETIVDSYSTEYVFMIFIMVNTYLIFYKVYDVVDYRQITVVFTYEIVLFVLINFIEYNNFYLMLIYHVVVYTLLLVFFRHNRLKYQSIIPMTNLTNNRNILYFA